MNFLRTSWDFNMDCPVIRQISPPFQKLSVGRELESGQVNGGAAGRMLAGNPFRIIESQRSGCCRNRELRVQNFSRSIGSVESNINMWRGAGRMGCQWARDYSYQHHYEGGSPHWGSPLFGS